MNPTEADLVIIGAGPAGMAAACEARAIGLSVMLLDEQPVTGGQIYRNVETAPRTRLDILGPDYAAGQRLVTEFRASGAHHRGGAVVWNVSHDGTVDYVAEGHSRKIVGRHVLLATGAMERPFPIDGWTIPGVMGAGAAQILLKGAGALPTGPVVLAGCGPLLYLLAWQYLRAGARIKAVIDTTATIDYVRATRHLVGAMRGWKDLKKGIDLLSVLRRHDVAVYSGYTDLAIEGDAQVEAIAFRHRGDPVRVATSLLLIHQGVVPNTQLSWSTGAEHRWDDGQLCWQPVTDPWGRLGDGIVYVAGDSRAIVGAQASAVQGRLAALAIGQRMGAITDFARRSASHASALKRLTRIRPFLDTLYRPKDDNRIPPSDNVVICRCEEVTAGHIRQYVELGCQGPTRPRRSGDAGWGRARGVSAG